MEAIGILWNEIIVRPMLNSIVLLYVLLWNNFGLSIIVFTVITRILTFPLTLRQIRSTQAMSRIQPRMAELQKKYPNDPQKRSQEMMRLYREAGVNPLGCLGPIVVQLPIFIGLYQALIQTVQGTPDAVVRLSQQLYPWLPGVAQVIPLDTHFLGLDLAAFPSQVSSPIAAVLPVLVGISTWVVQRMSTPPATTPQQASQNQIFMWMLPIMLAFFSYSFPMGLSLYWVASNLAGVLIQYRITGWGPLLGRQAPAPAATPAVAEPEPQPPTKETTEHGRTLRSDRKDRGRGYRTRHQRAGRRKGGS